MKKNIIILLAFFSFFSASAFTKETAVNTNSGLTSQVQSVNSGVINTNSGGATSDDEAFATPNPVNDPYEKFNRVMWGFNDMLDRFAIKPVSTLYNKVLPPPINRAIDNIFPNLFSVQTVINDVAQYNFYQATADSWRFVINSTIGLAGCIDVAAKMGLPLNQEDFGLTLAQWGYKQSNYLVLPFFGPRTVRDSISIPVDYYTSFYPWIHPLMAQFAVKAEETIDKRAQLLRFQDVYESAALDKYVFMRSAYMQNRSYEIEQNTQAGIPYSNTDTQKFHQDAYLDE